MYFSSVINIPLWDKAKWCGHMFGAEKGDSGQMTPLMGPVFDNEEAARKLFKEWERNFDRDAAKDLYISIVEYKDSFDYHVCFSPAFSPELSDDNLYALDARWHKMTPPESSKNLDFFKALYAEVEKFILVPSVMEGEKIRILDDVKIECSMVYFKSFETLTKGDLEYAHLVGSATMDENEDQSIESSEKVDLEYVDECLRRFEQLYINGELKETFDPIIVDRLQLIERSEDEGVINLESVDQTLLAIATMAVEQETSVQLSKVSIKETQGCYLNYLEKNLQELEEIRVEAKVSKEDLPALLEQSGEFRKHYYRIIKTWQNDLESYWTQAAPVVQYNLRKSDGLVLCYGGSSFPRASSKLWQSSLLLSDTLVVPDPLNTWSNRMFEAMKDENMYWALKDLTSASDYAELAKGDDPSVVFYPSYLGDKMADFLLDEAYDKTSFLASLIFEKDFTSFKQLDQFMSGLTSIDDLLREVKDPSYLLFDCEEDLNSRRQLELALEKQDTFRKSGLDLSAGQTVSFQILGRWMQREHALFNAERLGGFPIFDAPTSKQYYEWGLEYDSSKANIYSSDLTKNAALEALSNKNNVRGLTVDQLLKVKNTEPLIELRSILREALQAGEGRGVDVVQNVEAEYVRLVNELAKLRTSLKGSEKELLTNTIGCLTSVGFGVIAATVTGSPTIGALGALAGSLGLPSAKDVRKKHAEYRGILNEKRKHPVGFFC